MAQSSSCQHSTSDDHHERRRDRDLVRKGRYLNISVAGSSRGQSTTALASQDCLDLLFYNSSDTISHIMCFVFSFVSIDHPSGKRNTRSSPGTMGTKEVCGHSMWFSRLPSLLELDPYMSLSTLFDIPSNHRHFDRHP